MTQPSCWKVWLLAARPKTLTAGLMPVMAGTALAYAESGAFSLGIFLSALLTALCIQVGINYTNDALDYLKGADTEKRVGFARAVQQGWISPQVMLKGGYLAFALGIFSALLGAISYPAVLSIVLLCIFFGYFYTGGLYPIAYLGLGELFVILFFGLAITGTAYYVQTGYLSSSSLVAGAQIGILATALIAINNLRDKDQDIVAHKNTLAVRCGATFAKIEIVFCLLVPFIMQVYWWQTNMFLVAVVPLAVLPLAIYLAFSICSSKPSTAYNGDLEKAAAIHLLYSLLFVVACLWT